MAGVSADLELDLTAALRGIDDLESSLSSAVSGISGQVEQALEPLTSPVDVTVDVVTDTSAVESELATLDAQVQPITVPVVVDTSEATPPVAELAAESAAAESALAGLSGTAAGASTGLGDVASSASSLLEPLKALGPEVAAVVAAVTALSAATDFFFNAAVQAESATLRFNQTFGDMAGSVQAVDVGNLNTDLGTLSRSLGSSTSETKQAASSVGQLGVSFGASQREAALTAEQLTALASRAVALNPELGTVGQATEKLSNALITGRAKALAPFQLGLSKAAIEAKAAEIALADGGREVTIFDKQAAGAALAVAKLGGHLQEDIAQGAKNPAVQLKALTAEYNKVVTEMGKPLVVPVLQILKDFAPISQSAVRLLGTVVQSFVPLVGGIVAAIGPVFTTVFNTLAAAGRFVQPVFEGIGKVVGALTPIFQFLLIPTQLVGKAFSVLAPLGKALGDVLGLIADGAKILLSPLAKVVELVGGLPESVDPVTKALTKADGTIIKLADSSTLLTAVLSDTPDAFNKLAVAGTGFGGAAIAKQLDATSTSLADMQGFIKRGEAGFSDFAQSASASGAVVFKAVADGATLTAEDIKKLGVSFDELVKSGQIVTTRGTEITDALFNSTRAAQAQAAANIQQTATERSLTQAQIAALPEQARLLTGNSSAISQQQVLNAELAVADQRLLAQQGSLSGNAAAWVNLTGQIAAGTITQATAAESLRVVGLNADQAKVFFDAAKGAVDQFVNTAVATIPTAAEVFKKLGTAASPGGGFVLLQDLKNTENAASNFVFNLAFLGAQGFANLQAQAAQAGPAATQELVNSIKAGGPQLAAATEAQAATTQQATRTAAEQVAKILRENTAVQVDAAVVAGKAVGAGFDANLNFAGVTRTAVEQVGPAIAEANVKVVEDAKGEGAKTGRGLLAGVEQGVKDGTPDTVLAVQAAMKSLVTAGNRELGVKSPSKVFAETGMNIAAGLVMGMRDGMPDVVAEAEAITAAAAAAAAGQAGSVVFPVAVPNVANTAATGGTSGGSSSGAPVFNISIQLQFDAVPTEEQAAAAAGGAADGMMDSISRRLGVEAGLV